MSKIIAALLFLSGAGLAVFAYSDYADYETGRNVVRYWRGRPDELPAGIRREEREQFIAREVAAADRNYRQALLSGAGSLLCGAGGVGLLVFGRWKGRRASVPARRETEADSLQRAEAVQRWASAMLARPLEVRFSRLQGILLLALTIFFLGLSLLIFIVNGLTAANAFLPVMLLLLLAGLYFLTYRAQQRAAYRFDLAGITRGDKLRLPWHELRSVDYLLAQRNRRGGQIIWRIELTFANDCAWLIPRRIRNWEEVNNLLRTIPVPQQQRRA